MKPDATTDFTAMLNALTRPEAFPFALPAEGSVSVIQTHASAVLLAANRVYKLKKPKDFGFFDFSTPALRRHFCGQEVLVNRRLAPHVYLGVAPVMGYPGGRFHFGPTFAPRNVPPPGSMLDDACVVDYAVVMVRLPDEAALENRVRRGTADGPMLAEIARYVAAFHATTHTDEHIARFGAIEVIRGNWEENFAQMRPYLGRTLDAATFDRIADYVHRFLAGRGALFASRVRDGRIRDCHGDLRLQHIYLLDTMDNPAQRLAILDGIEFNERFRYGDVAGEVAFLTMELDGAGRSDLTHTFLERYVAETGDDALRELLPFYACYRACVRGKVQSFQLDEPEVPQTQRESARQQARLLFRQAAHYSSGPIGPTLLLVGGLMGTGKSTLALALHRELGWALLSSDTTRKRLAHLDPARPQAQAFGQGVYNAAWTARTYDALIEKAGEALAAPSCWMPPSYAGLIARLLLASRQPMERAYCSLNAPARERWRCRGSRSAGSRATREARNPAKRPRVRQTGGLTSTMPSRTRGSRSTQARSRIQDTSRPRPCSHSLPLSSRCWKRCGCRISSAGFVRGSMNRRGWCAFCAMVL